MRSSAPDFVGCDTDLGDPNIVDTLGQLGSNPRGGLWIADSDIWSRLGLTSRYSAVDTAANSAWKAATRLCMYSGVRMRVAGSFTNGRSVS